MSRTAYHCFKVTSEDRLYITLPMYHSAGGVLGAAHVLTSGSSAVIRRRFSASNFWDDCIQYKCTVRGFCIIRVTVQYKWISIAKVSQYIGEICRYLLAQPERESDNQHQIRLMYGNGMHKATWLEFVKRFKVHHIGEIYGATEGNATLGR